MIIEDRSWLILRLQQTQTIVGCGFGARLILKTILGLIMESTLIRSLNSAQ